MKKTRRLLSIASAAVLSVGAMAAFAGCDTKKPEVAITYEFNGEEYKVEYVLSREGAPQTVQHFIELADAKYYDGTIIHDYAEDGAFLYGGGYTWDESAPTARTKIVERDYLTWVKDYEQKNNYKFTQSVFAHDANGAEYSTPLYSVYGEFAKNGCTANSKKPSHNYNVAPGALVMYYTDKGDDNTLVKVQRSDGKGWQEGNKYAENCATSLFYTYTSKGSNVSLDEKYSVFGNAKDYSQLKELLDAIEKYKDEHLDTDGESFAEEVKIDNVNAYDFFDTVRGLNVSATYHVPVSPIVLKEVKVVKY